MFKDLENLIDFEQFQELFEALAENKEYNYSENGLNISAKSSDGCTTLQISYKEPKDIAKTEAEDFKKYLENIDEDIFVGTCELMGQAEITKISNCLSSEDIDSVRAGELKFKSYLKEYLNSQIKYYQSCWNTYLK